MIVNVYLRAYNDQPDFEISEPEAVCVALLGFTSVLVHNQGAAVLDDQDTLNLDGSSFNTSEVQTDIADGSIIVQNVSESVRQNALKRFVKLTNLFGFCEEILTRFRDY